MVDIVKNNIAAIHEICKKHHAELLYLFGSGARQFDFDAKSDIDFLYRFKVSEINELDYADNFFDLKFNLEKIIGRKIDLLSIDHVTNPYLLKRIEENKVQVYAA